MPNFITYKKLKELQGAAKGGNPTAKSIIDKYMSDSVDMDSIGRLMDEYYGSLGLDQMAQSAPQEQIAAEPVAEDVMTDEAAPELPVEDPHLIDDPVDDIQPEAAEAIDISEDLDRELDGLIDDDEFDDESFQDFLADKRRNALRERKNAAYFKAFDQGGRDSYLASKKDAFTHSFDGRRRKIERGINDMDGALTAYGHMVTDMPDDGSELDMDIASKAYDDLTGNQDAMDAFGRSWDDADMESMRSILTSLVGQYGKSNVAAVLNTLRDDCKAWGAKCNGRMDNAISKYGKSLTDLLQ